MAVSFSGAHPRSRGENEDRVGVLESEVGSSPLTRGKPDGLQRREPRSGLIPAHAGKTFCGSGEDDRHGAHPRSRGENATIGVLSQFVAGSSPLTRGKPHVIAETRRSDGLIPAHAGKTAFASLSVSPRRAHPRSRGENKHAATPQPIAWGSSPLTRGKRLGLTRAWMRRGLIPAHAGKTGWPGSNGR